MGEVANIYIYIYIYMYVCIYIICVCVYVCIHTHVRGMMDCFGYIGGAMSPLAEVPVDLLPPYVVYASLAQAPCWSTVLLHVHALTHVVYTGSVLINCPLARARSHTRCLHRLLADQLSSYTCTRFFFCSHRLHADLPGHRCLALEKRRQR